MLIRVMVEVNWTMEDDMNTRRRKMAEVLNDVAFQMTLRAGAGEPLTGDIMFGGKRVGWVNLWGGHLSDNDDVPAGATVITKNEQD